jgi:hypothetical protein
VDITRQYAERFVQHRLRRFGDQWNFALRTLPITPPWTMRVDPDGRLSDKLKGNLLAALQQGDDDGILLDPRL